MIYDKCYWCVWRGISGRYWGSKIGYHASPMLVLIHTRYGWHASCNGTVAGPAVHHSAKPEKVGHSSSSKSFVWKYRSELELCIISLIIFISSFSKTNEILNFSLLQVIFLHYTSFRYYINIIYYLPNQHNFQTFASWTLKLLKLMDFLATGLMKLKEISFSLSAKIQLKL